MRQSKQDSSVNRRRFLALTAGVSAVGVAGCTDVVNNFGSESTTAATAPFSLLITDAPADIGDFDSVNVTFDHARVFRADGVDNEDRDLDDDEDGNTTDSEGGEAGSHDDHGNQTDQEGAGNETTGTDEDDLNTTDNDGEEDRGWFILDIEGETVDLTDVIGDVAESVFEGELEEGTYSKVELHVDSVDATLTDGESADVKVPSEKLQLTKPFDVVADEPLEFVYDINVVRKGQGNEYNLLPVISGSGVNGEDVTVERKDETDKGDESDGNEDENNQTDDAGEDDSS